MTRGASSGRTGNLNNGLIALKGGKMMTLRTFYAGGFDGRIDYPMPAGKAGGYGRPAATERHG
jgi:hypothetical protein